MTDLKETLIEEVKSFQEWTRTSEQEDELRWFARLELEDATLSGDTAMFVWRDPADGTRHGWRWEIVADRLYLLHAHLDEDLMTTEPTEPDEHGIRWWGVIEPD